VPYRHNETPANKRNNLKSVEFRRQFARDVSIKVLGCWDTVGSLGIPDLIPYFPIDNWINKEYEFFDTKINERIENAFHTVAIDEIRVAYPTTPMKSDRPNQVKQVWFPGEHGCIGGGTEQTQG